MGGVTMKTVAAQDPSRRRGLLAVAVLVTALFLAACSGGYSPAGGSPSTAGASAASAVAYSACMRTHGVPNYRDPDSSGVLPKTDAQQLGVGPTQYQAAQHACQHLLPSGGSFQQQTLHCYQTGDCPPALVQRMFAADRKLARCMRSHGGAQFPRPHHR